jgi:hypothetical protein
LRGCVCATAEGAHTEDSAVTDAVFQPPMLALNAFALLNACEPTTRGPHHTAPQADRPCRATPIHKRRCSRHAIRNHAACVTDTDANAYVCVCVCVYARVWVHKHIISLYIHGRPKGAHTEDSVVTDAVFQPPMLALNADA